MTVSDQQEPDEPTQRRDLRQELFEDLCDRFVTELEKDASLPAAVQAALAGVLEEEATTVAEIIEAVSRNGSVPEESNGE